MKTYTCKNDGSHTKTESIPALGHDWNDGEVTTPATCEKRCDRDSGHRPQLWRMADGDCADLHGGRC